jgi:hypothetical protein
MGDLFGFRRKISIRKTALWEGKERLPMVAKLGRLNETPASGRQRHSFRLVVGTRVGDKWLSQLARC